MEKRKKKYPCIHQFPTFICVGTGRAGTTSLYAYLRQHPDVYVTPVKEPRYFAFREDEEPTDPRRREIYEMSVTDREDYEALFENHVGESAAGEISPIYLHEPVAPARIKEAVPNVRLIAILRDPIDKAYSYFGLNIRKGKASLGEFKSAIRSGKHNDKNSLFYRKYIYPGLYGKHLRRYKSRFDSSQIMTVKFRNYAKNTRKKVKLAYEHIGVNESFNPDTSVSRNPSGSAKYRWVDFFLSGKNPLITERALDYVPAVIRDAAAVIKNANIKTLPPLEPSVRDELLNVYADDIHRVDNLVSWSVDDWLRSNDR